MGLDRFSQLGDAVSEPLTGSIVFNPSVQLLSKSVPGQLVRLTGMAEGVSRFEH